MLDVHGVTGSSPVPRTTKNLEAIMVSRFSFFLFRFSFGINMPFFHLAKVAKIMYDTVNIEKLAPLGALGGLRCGLF